MGYKTTFELTIKKGNKNLIKVLRKINEEAKFAITKDGGCNETTTWYNHEEDLKAFSLKYPKAIFELYGDGEDNDDTWVKYFKNGKCQLCPAIISFDDFDENKLE